MTEAAADLAICIPTRNRARFLRDCLRHLAGFTRLRLEVVVTDNASEDGTAEVARAFDNGTFARFTYHRHGQDVGMTRNMDAALRLAAAPYLWVLSDDDIAYESGLAFLLERLEQFPSAVAACGRYDAVASTVVGSDPFRVPSKMGLVPRGRIESLAEYIFITDGHPVMRREAYQRHCGMEEKGFGLLPLYARLLDHGDILFIESSIIAHLSNPDSLSSRLPEPWFVDFVTGDIEVAMASMEQPVGQAVVSHVRRAVLGLVYLNAARFARIRGDLLLMRHFLQRSKALEMAGNDLLAHWESAFLVATAVQRLARQLGDLGARRVILEDSAPMRLVAAQLQAALPGAKCELRLQPGDAGDPHEASVTWAPSGLDRAGPRFAFLDVVGWCRVTAFPMSVGIGADGRLAIAYAAPEAAELLRRVPRSFSVMMENYGTG